MVDRYRLVSEFLDSSTGLFKDNLTGDITPQMLRDFTLSSYQPQGICDFRIGLEQDIAVSSTDVQSASKLYLNHCGRGNRLALSDGSSWALFSAKNFALGGLTGLTSARNYDVFAAYSTPTHSSTNTSTDIVTWSSNPGWTTGTYVIVKDTGSGLTAGTAYWYNRASGTTGSFHTSLANALAGTSKVDLTGNVTQTLVGIFCDLGPTWNTGSGSDTARGTGASSTELTTLNGVTVNKYSVTGTIGAGTIAANAGVYLGSVRTVSTTGVSDMAGGNLTYQAGKRFVWNHYNGELRPLRLIEVGDTASWTYNTNSWRQVNGNTANKTEFLLGLGPQLMAMNMYGVAVLDASEQARMSIGLDGNSPNGMWGFTTQNVNTFNQTGFIYAVYQGEIALGYHDIRWLENSVSSTVVTYYGHTSGAYYCGLSGLVKC